MLGRTLLFHTCTIDIKCQWWCLDPWKGFQTNHFKSVNASDNADADTRGEEDSDGVASCERTFNVTDWANDIYQTLFITSGMRRFYFLVCFYLPVFTGEIPIVVLRFSIQRSLVGGFFPRKTKVHDPVSSLYPQRFIYTGQKQTQKRISFFDLSRCSTWTLNCILYELIWKRCRFPPTINEPHPGWMYME